MLLFADGFGHYNQLQQKWTFATSANISSGSARGSGTQGCTITGSGQTSKSTPYRSTFFIGGAIRLNVGGSYGGTIYQLAAPTLGSGLQILVSINVQADASISVYAGSTLIGNTGLSTPPFFFSAGVFYYVDFEIQLSGSAPISATVTLRVNTHTYLSAVSGNTGVAASSLICNTAAADFHVFGGAQVNGSSSLADVYINDNTAVSGQPAANTFRGDIQVGPYLVPRVDQTINWAGFGATIPPSFALVNEVPPDGDTTYIYDNTIGDIDTFLFTTVSSLVGLIQAAHLCVFQRKDNEGSRVTEMLAGGTIIPAATSPYGNLCYLSDNYYYYTFPMDVDPASSAPFTVASINAEAFGIEIQA